MTAIQRPFRYHVVSFLAGLIIFIGVFQTLQLVSGNAPASVAKIWRSAGLCVSGIALLFSASLLRDRTKRLP